MQIALISLLCAQVVILGMGAAIYLRQRSQADAERIAKVDWGIKLEAAIGKADSAKQAVDMIEVSHYNKLRVKFEEQILEIAALKGELAEVKKELERVRVKAETAARMDRHARKKEAEEAASAQPGPEAALDAARRNGTAIPLFPPGDASPRPRARSTFGQIP